MKKYSFCFLIVLLNSLHAISQSSSEYRDSLLNLLSKSVSDSVKAEVYNKLGYYYFQQESNADTSVYYLQKGVDLAKKSGITRQYLDIKMSLAFNQTVVGNNPESIRLLDEIATESKDVDITVYSRSFIFQGRNFMEIGDYAKGLENVLKGYQIFLRNIDKYDPINREADLTGQTMSIAATYLSLNNLDSAEHYINVSLHYFNLMNDPIGRSYPFAYTIPQIKSAIFLKRGMLDSAVNYAKLGREKAKLLKNDYGIQINDLAIAEAEMALGNINEAKNKLSSVIELGHQTHNYLSVKQAAQSLSNIFKKENNIAQAYKYNLLAQEANDSLFNQQKMNALRSHLVEESIKNQKLLAQQEKDKIENANTDKSNKLKLGLGSLALLTLVGFVGYRRQKKYGDKIAQQADALVKQNTALEIEAALEKIRSTSLAMRHTSELQNVVNEVFIRLKELGLVFDGGVGIHFFNEATHDAEIWVAAPDDISPSSKINLPYDEEGYKDNPLIQDVWKAKASGTHLFNKFYSHEEKNTYFQYVSKHNDLALPPSVRDFIFYTDSYTVTAIAEKNSQLVANSWTRQKFSAEQFEILKRIGKVFEQAYLRFLDLKTAEAQAREAKIEAALEKIRNQSLAMHTSDELESVMKIMLDKLKELEVANGTIALQFFDEKTKSCDFWVSNDLQHIAKVKLPYDQKFFREDNYMKHCWEAKEKGESFINRLYSFEQKNAYFDYVFAYNDLEITPQHVRDFIYQAPNHIQTLLIESHSALFADSWNGVYFSDEQINVLKRVAKVFNQAYIRFLDIKKAEVQTREAQIEASLERVRSRTLAMQSSDELSSIIGFIYTEIGKMDVSLLACFIMTFNPENFDATWWFSMGESVDLGKGFLVPYSEHSPQMHYIHRWKDRVERSRYHMQGDEKKNWDQYLFYKTDLVHLPSVVKDGMQSFTSIYLDSSFQSFGCLTTGNPEPLSEDAVDLLVRYAKVFDLTFTRFNDLKLAEAQARESKIEVVLERIRSRAMAMDTSEEFNTLIGFIYTECVKLDMHLDRGFIMTFDKETKDAYWWMVSADAADKPMKILVKYHEYAPHLAILKGWQDREQKWSYLLEGENKSTWDDYQFTNALSQLPDAVKNNMRSVKSVILNASFQNFGCIMLSSFEPLSNDHFDVLIRVSKVFELTYTRFLDLQLKESRARESKIEVVLERIRNRALVMNSSDELNALIQDIYSECVKLDMNLDRSLIITYDKDTNDSRWWIAGPEAKGVSTGHLVKYHEYAPSLALLKGWQDRVQKWSYVYEGENKKSWNEYVFTHTGLKDLPPPMIAGMNELPRVIFNCSFQNFGCIMLPTTEPMSDEHFELLVRLGKVIDLAYTRFLHLQYKEKQAREAQIEASLEKIRGSALAMNSSNDFYQVMNTLREQLILLGQDAWETSVIEFYYPDKGYFEAWHVLNDSTIENESRIGRNKIEFNACSLTQRFLHSYLDTNHEEYTIFTEGTELKEWLTYLHKVVPDEKARMNIDSTYNTYMHHSRFSAGALVMVAINANPPSEESKYLQKRAASVFDLAYKRYLDLQQKEKLARQAEEDFINLKLEKKKTEEALAELKATQKQLVHSEKMASLGELTAGIAHEIQNPLNFVNNFSSINTELLDDLSMEIINQNTEEINVLISDIKENSNKINHHGLRASNIVKNMLEHSRKSTGEKTMVDINAMCDEYIRLSYHGLRAKDKTFNADFKIDLDPTMPKLHVVAQDISRVLLNILNNAFQAISTSLSGRDSFESNSNVVTITTKYSASLRLCEISVTDTGPGIPHHIKDKIFQPFFTTKPTGQGTGLGLSLSYDIIKAHGGTIEVESSEGVGTTFTIKLNAD